MRGASDHSPEASHEIAPELQRKCDAGAVPPSRPIRSAPMIDGEPGAEFQDEVVIRRLRWTSEDSGFAVIDADREGDDVVLVGVLAHLEERERVRIAGTWQDDKRFGMQVKVRLAEPVAPSGELALIAYLKRVKYIGGRRAERLLERYGDDVLEAIDAD